MSKVMPRHLGTLIRSWQEVEQEHDELREKLMGLQQQAANQVQPRLRRGGPFLSNQEILADFTGAGRQADMATDALIDQFDRQLDSHREELDLLVEVSFDAPTSKALLEKLHPMMPTMSGGPETEYRQFQLTLQGAVDGIDDILRRLPHFEEKPDDGGDIPMPMSGLLRDKITIEKPDGRRFENVDSSVQGNKVFIMNTKIPLEEGDRLTRVLPSGVSETYVVNDPGYVAGGNLSHYEAKVTKEGKADKTSPPASITNVYNLTGENPRVNVQSHDTSTNVVTKSETTSLFVDMRTAVQSEVDDPEAQAQLISKIDELEQAKGTRTFTDRYKEFMALAANHMSVLAPFLPHLSGLLS